MGYGIKRSILRIRELLCLSEAIKYGSISKAAQKNNMKQANLSYQIKMLEDELGENLLERVYNGVRISEAGRDVYALACDLENIINKSRNLNIKAFKVSGDIRLWTSDGLGISYISDCFSEFYTKYPKVNIEVFCSLDMPKPEQFDMAVLYEKPKDTSLKIIAEYNLKFGIFASKFYLSQFGFPKNIKEIQENHRICTKLNYANIWEKWENVIKNAKNISASTNSSAMLLHLIKDGIGIGILPIGISSNDSSLVRVLNKFTLNHKCWLVVREEVKDIDKIKALTSFIKGASDKL